jgi:hypothetical protein
MVHVTLPGDACAMMAGQDLPATVMIVLRAVIVVLVATLVGRASAKSSSKVRVANFATT